MALSNEKQFALEVFDIFTQLAEPEIKSNIIRRFWNMFEGYAKKKILNKPDNEIIEGLLVIHRKLNSRFKDLDNSVSMNVSEQLGSVPIPNVGELARVKNLTKVSKAQAEQLIKEIF